ncbi:MAG: PIN domain-containing protein [candidate division NC10 bacterium]|jgi:uncharacterized protein YacL|nr:PIN domain-containing protein [candidate division NC10 bacterium]
MSELVVRAVYVVLCGAVGLASGALMGRGEAAPWQGIVLGLAFGGASLLLEVGLRKAAPRAIISGLLGFILGLIVALLLLAALDGPLAALPLPIASSVQVLLVLLCVYVGASLAVEKGQAVHLVSFLRALKEQPRAESYKILDTSVIIDGRIADICETGFIEGTLVVPQFVLRELQHIADSSDPLKRNRGRRGLDILQKMQKDADVQVKLHEMDFPEIREVDAKLVALAKTLNAKVVTNDFNLNKVCELQGVAVLNINALTNALKPVVLPGEDMRVYVLKEGKEYNQGIAYLDDGTMVVVDNGRRHIGQTIDVCVTSVLQTTAGRMIFSRLKEEAEAA